MCTRPGPARPDRGRRSDDRSVFCRTWWQLVVHPVSVHVNTASLFRTSLVPKNGKSTEHVANIVIYVIRPRAFQARVIQRYKVYIVPRYRVRDISNRLGHVNALQLWFDDHEGNVETETKN